DWHEGDDTFDISNNVVDDSNAQVNGLGTYYDNDPTKIVRTASTDPNYFFGNQSNAPLNTWDFDAVWGAHETEYPTFLHGAVAVNLLSAEDGSKVRISQAGCDAINTSSTIKESSLSVQDPGYTYPVGFSSFSLTGCGASAQITATFTGAFDVNKIVIRKYNSISGVFSTLNTANSGLVLTSTTLDGKPALKVSYTIADGGLLDQDGLVDGNIADPIGVGSAFGVPNTGFGSGLSLIKSKANI
ncbi:MAG: choice-of-anchor U domain-containing protein, partial [Candidatus Saccharibacteria bacterium]